ncbi:hypothetical protein QBZ16_002297 [Prototheca wickerhamii]|uniref:Tyrosine specific protein phosphatases domain-containing protein n=1 Tax=Prototheca wickerhamii TaxID=3111 RepID=A0AAD9IP83_PROWI|nr:hypothetical protein QBZ16_002297 [Prototheca wickerhamii]
MSERMGLYFHAITPNVIVGSQPRSAVDVAHLVDHQGVSAILNMQQDTDLRHWAVDLEGLRRAAAVRGVEYVRAPTVDFDAGSLRSTLPLAVARLLSLVRAGKRVYLHCTAGLGRAPAVCIAALYWDGLGILSPDAEDLVRLQEAYDHVTSIRACGPNKVSSEGPVDAIRGATGDLLSGSNVGNLQRHGPAAFATLHARDRKAILARL